MKDAQPSVIYARDYTPPTFLVERVKLDFDLYEDHALVRSSIDFKRNSAATKADHLTLDGEQLELLALLVDGQALHADAYSTDDKTLTVFDVPDQFTLQCDTRIKPQLNTSLEGLYKSSSMFCTQCEAEGFRKITYFPDRPDVMTVFTVTITADKGSYPVLLSNGNCTDSVDLADGRHRTVWHDPFRKPSYLFALVAGDLVSLDDSFTTVSGRNVDLKIFVEPKDLNKCDHAMDSLKRSMKWDEQVYGREYDLDVFNIVAVDDFNMGAMENKSLNIFNTSCVLASPESTTDAGFQRVEAVVAHEYFHNWSGNRVTCRDWFQLSLKEGFTVFRDSQFSSDMGSPTVKRIEDVTMLRSVQFAEDAGPMAHPIRPDSFVEINNFYTATVYEKGAEVVRMLHTLLGAEGFRKGSDLYFERFDGQAVTCEDFVKSMEDANAVDLTQFRRWYSQAGTPRLSVTGAYDESTREYRLTVSQSCAPSPGQPVKEPYHIPLAMGLIGEAGALRLTLKDQAPDLEAADNTSMVLAVTEPEQTFVFTDVPEPPVPSLLRGFSAPVNLDVDLAADALETLIVRDDDGFSRWNAQQQLAAQALFARIDGVAPARADELEAAVISVSAGLLAQADSLDPALLAQMLRLPGESTLAEMRQPVDIQANFAAREALLSKIAAELNDQLWQTYSQLHERGRSQPYQADALQIGERSLKNICLSLLMRMDDEKTLSACQQQFASATNMTDRLAALVALINSNATEAKQQALEAFYQQWQNESLVVNLWFQVQASAPANNALTAVKKLMEHPAFEIRNPNKVRAVIGAFAGQNLVNFHSADGSGYQFLADQVLTLDSFNPQVASRMVGPLSKWQKFLPAQQALMRAELERIAQAPNLSPDVYEVVSKSLK